MIEASFAYDFAAVFSRAGTEIKDSIGGAHDFGIVLDDKDSVSQIAEVVQDINQLGRVAAVKADGRFIQYIQRTDQA